MKFYSILKDTSFKYLWKCGNPKVQDFYNRVIGKRLGIDIRNFVLAPEELMIDNRFSIQNRVDILLYDKPNYGDENLRDVSIIINIEANSNECYLEYIENKNLTYLLKLAGNFYTYNRKSNLYRKNINVQQFNFNNYSNPNCQNCMSLVRDISTRSIQNSLEDVNKNVVRSYDLYLPKYKEIEYTKLTEEEKDIRMFTCESWDEMKELANGNEERTAVMKELEKILNDPVFAASYDGELYDKGLREEYKALGFEQGLEEGHAEGHAQGLEEGFNDAIKQSIVNLYENDAPLELISKSMNMTTKQVKKIIEENKR